MNISIVFVLYRAIYISPVPTIRTVKGRVVFFRAQHEKISTLNPLTVRIFAAAFSPPKTGNRIFTTLHPAFVRFILAAKPSALARRSLSAFAGLRAPRPRPQTRNRSSPYSAGKRVNMECLPLPQPLFRGGQGFYIPCPKKAFQPSTRCVFTLFLCLLPLNRIAFPYP